MKLIHSKPNPYVEFETSTRAEFIKICHILAKGLDITSRSTTLVGISGNFDVGKALVADAMLHALDDMRKKYKIDEEKKMSQETIPGEALNKPPHVFFKHSGFDVRLDFVRSANHIRDLDAPNLSRLIILSHNAYPNYNNPDISITLTKQGDLPLWRRQWDITILSPQLYKNENMQQAISHLRQFHTTRQKRLSLKK